MKTQLTKEIRHTKGPWPIFTYENGAARIGDRDAEIAVLHFGPSSNKEEIQANARLIAAAPEMLEALKDIRNICEDHHTEGLEFNYREVLQATEQAIQKAEK